MMVYKIEFYAYLPKIKIYFFLHFDLRSDPDPWNLLSRIREKKCRILIPGFCVYKFMNNIICIKTVI